MNICRKRILLALAFMVAFIATTRHVFVYACSCVGGGGSFIMNRESDDKTLILPRDARGVLWWGVEWDRRNVEKRNFAVRLLSGARERDLDFRVIEVKPTLYLIAPTEKLAPGNRYLFTHKNEKHQPASAQTVEAVVENTAFAAIKDHVQLWLLPARRTHLGVETGGMCSRSADVVAQDFYISEPAAIERWRFALLFDTVLNGKTDWKPRAHVCGNYPLGSSWRGHGIDIIFAECDNGASNEVAGRREGEYDVHMTVSVPGTKLLAITKKHSFRLTCASPTLK